MVCFPRAALQLFRTLGKGKDTLPLLREDGRSRFNKERTYLMMHSLLGAGHWTQISTLALVTASCWTISRPMVLQ